MWGLGEWSFDDLGLRHPSEFPTAAGRKAAYDDQDDGVDPADPNETVQTTILSRVIR